MFRAGRHILWHFGRSLQFTSVQKHFGLSSLPVYVVKVLVNAFLKGRVSVVHDVAHIIQFLEPDLGVYVKTPALLVQMRGSEHLQQVLGECVKRVEEQVITEMFHFQSPFFPMKQI